MPYSDYEEDGDWDVTTTTESFRAANNDPVGTPIVGDLDNDGTNEILMVDQDNVEIYQGTTLTAIAGQTCNGDIDHAILHDIDADDTLEVITVGSGWFCGFDFNGTHLNKTWNWSVTDVSSEYEVGCHETFCIIIEARYTAGVPSNEDILAHLYTTAGSLDNLLLDTAINNGDWYLPMTRHIEVVYDSTDSRYEWVASAYQEGSNALSIFALYHNTTDVLEEHQIDISATYANPMTYGTNTFTTPSTYNYDPSSAGYEVVVAYMTSADDFTFNMLSNSLTSIDTYGVPIFDEGELVSNVIRMQGLDDAGYEFCAMGYDLTGDELNFVCANAGSGEVNGLDVATPYDLTEASLTGNTPSDRISRVLVTPVQTSTTTTGGVDLNEVLTPYGVFRLRYELISGDDLVYEFQLEGDTADGSAVWYDVEDVGYSDILYLTEDGLYYLDDGFVNSQTVINSYTINTGNPVCQDVTVKITMEVSDVNDDDVYACWINETYVNQTVKSSINNQTGSGETTFNFYYDADEVGTFQLHLYCDDGEHTTIEEETYDIQVSNNTAICNEYGEDPVTTTLTVDEDEAADEAFESSITSAIDDLGLDSSTGHGWFAIIVILAASLGAMVWISKMGVSGTMPFIFAGSGVMLGASYIFLTLGFITTFVFIIFLLVAVLTIVLTLFGRSGVGGG